MFYRILKFHCKKITIHKLFNSNWSLLIGNLLILKPARALRIRIQRSKLPANQTSDLEQVYFAPDIASSRFLEPIYVSIGGSRNLDS